MSRPSSPSVDVAPSPPDPSASTSSPRPSAASVSQSPTDLSIIGPYQLGKTIGQGIFAKVKLGEDEFRQKVAIKIFDKQQLSRSKHQQTQVEKEINALRICRHSHIVQYYEVLETSHHVFLVMEHLEAGELYDYILEKQRLSEEEGGRFFLQICSALLYCHERGICHRDLKPENILLTKEKNPAVKLVDFGLANYVDTGAEYGAKALRTQCGSPHYCCPEILQGGKYNGIQADVWSLGVLLYAMLCGSLPFNAKSIPLLIKKIVEGKFKFPKFVSASARSLISSVLQLNPDQRPRLIDIMRHPWLQEIGVITSSDSANNFIHNAILAQTLTISRPEIISPDNDQHRQTADIIMKQQQQLEKKERTMAAAAAGIDEKNIIPPAASLRFPNAELEAAGAFNEPALDQEPQITNTRVVVTSAGFGGRGSEVRPRRLTQSKAAGGGGGGGDSPEQPKLEGLTEEDEVSSDSVKESSVLKDDGVQKCHICHKPLDPKVSLFSPTNAATSSSAPPSPNSDFCSCHLTQSNASTTSTDAKDSSLSAALQSKLAAKKAHEERKTGSLLATPNAKTTTQGRAALISTPQPIVPSPNDSSTSSANTSNSSAAAPTEPPPEVTADFAEYSVTAAFGAMNSSLSNLRDDYFHPDDKYRKQKLSEYQKFLALTPTEQETVRRENEQKLFLSCQNGDVKTLLTLIEAEIEEKGTILIPPAVDIRAATTDKYTALHFAAENGHYNCVAALVASMQAFDINARTLSNYSALMLAAKEGHEPVVQLLIRYGAAIHISSTEGKSAIFLSRENNYTRIAQLLTNASSQRHRRHTKFLGTASESEESIRMLNSEFLRSVEAGDIEKVRHLLNLSESVDVPHQTDRVLTRRGSDKSHLTKEQIAQKLKEEQEMEMKKPKYRVDVHARGIDNWSCLHFAARKNRTQIMQLLLRYSDPPDIDGVTKNGWTALHLACDRGNLDSVSLLVNNGASADIVSNDGWTPRKLAEEGGFTEIVQLIDRTQTEKSKAKQK